jgi:energy-coupling factor transporter ATP-binding protein EcfA2
MEKLQKLPVTESGFEALRKQNMLYVDKTERMLELINKGSYLFLSRPRRFGKSLLINTLKALFENKKELFEGLYIYDKWEWAEHGVIHLDFSKIQYHRDIEGFENHIKKILQKVALSYNFEIEEGNYLFQLQNLISKLQKKFNRGVVVLIDEYDKPITDFINSPTKGKENQYLLNRFYTVLKAEHANLRLVFVTGTSKVLKVLWGMNNVLDVSFHREMNDVIGINKKEILKYFENYISVLELSNNSSREQILEKIKYWYGGYSWNGKNKIYHPNSIVNLMLSQEFKIFCTRGNQEYILPQEVINFKNIEVSRREFEIDEDLVISFIGLLFNEGYLTISKTEEDDLMELYTLNHPNQEMRNSVINMLKKYTLNANLILQA